MCASNHYLWRNYTHVATRCRGTLDLSPDICKPPNRRVAVTSPVTFAPGDTPPERAVNEGLRAGHDTNVGTVGECSRLDLLNFGDQVSELIFYFHIELTSLLILPDALEWKPERWLSPLPESIMDSKIPGIYSHL